MPKLNIVVQTCILVFYSLAKLIFYCIESKNTNYIEVFDVGQGDSILIHVNSAKILVDGGPDYDISYQLQQYMLFNSCDLTMIVLTHPHADHIAGLNRLMEYCRVAKVVYPYFDVKTSLDAQFLRLVEKKETLIPDIDTTLSIGDATLTVLWPPKGYLSKNINNQSIVIALKKGSFEALLLGDIELEALTQVPFSNFMEKSGKNIDLLKVSHHGSATGTDLSFLEKFNIKTAAISVAAKNVYNLPSKHVVELLKERNIDVYQTDIFGSIVIRIDKL